MKRPTVLLAVLALGCGVALITSGSATAVDYSDTTPPTLTSFTLSPTQVARGVASEVDVTIVVTDDVNGMRLRSGGLKHCTQNAWYSPSEIPGPQLLEREVDPVTGSVAETWVASLLIPADAPEGEYIGYLSVIDAAGNRTPTLWPAGPGCPREDALLQPNPVFTVLAAGAEVPEPVEPIANQLVALESQVDQLTADNATLQSRYDTLNRKYQKALSDIKKLKAKLKR